MKLLTEPQSFYGAGFLRKIGLFIVCCIIGMGFISCKDDEDDDTETSPSLGGDLFFEMPAYAFIGSTFEVYGGGITDPQDSVSYRWTSATLMKDTVYGTSCTIQIPDTIGSLTLTLTASRSGYYEKTLEKAVVSIKKGMGGSLTDYSLPITKITDPRDGQVYAVTEIDSLIWFAQNLNWEGAGSGYAKADAIGYILGRLYTWNDATGGVSGSGLGGGPQGVCPEGWSIPTKEDWENLAISLSGGDTLAFDKSWKGLGDNVMINAKLNGAKFWPYSPDCNPENMFGWAALSGGSCTNNYNNYSGIMNYGFWWSSTEMSADKAFYRYIYYNRPDFDFNYTYKDGFAASVRCVKRK